MREEIAQTLIPALATSGGHVEPDVLYTSAQLAAICGMSPRSVERWRIDGRRPTVTRLYPGAPPRYRGSDILEAMNRAREVKA